MPDSREAMEDVAQKVRSALDSADLAALAELLDPDVHWGPPGARRPVCENRDQVVAWYERGRDAGGRARVREVGVYGDRLLVELEVHGTPLASSRGGAALRWQALTVRDGRVVDIVGFGDRLDALAHVRRST